MTEMSRYRTAMTTLTLREYKEHPVNIALDPGQLAGLKAEHIEVSPPESSDATWVLKPSSHVGALRLGTLSIVVRPKIQVDRVMFLVAYALDPRQWRQYVSHLVPDDDVLESIIPAFLYHTRQAIRRGLLQGYRHEEDSLHTVRGRIRFGDQINRRHGAPIPLEMVYDEFTEDIEENRLLKTAFHRLSHLPVRSLQARKDVNALRPLFNNVGLAAYVHGAPQVSYTRLNAHYRPAVELARLIIDNSSLELRHGDVAGGSFMLDMNRVFEQFLFVALQEELGLSASEWRKGNLTLDEDEAIKLEPDLSWWAEERCRFVGDAKYKRLGNDGFRHPDIYQMLAYCTASGLPSGLLVYAAGEAEPGVYRIKNAGKTIEVVSLNLAGTPETILNEVRRVGERVRSMAASQTAVPGAAPSNLPYSYRD